MPHSRVVWLVTVVLIAVAGVLVGRLVWIDEPVPGSMAPPEDVDSMQASVKGVLTIAAYGAAGADGPRVLHSTELARGPAYGAMEDNDIRGFLDGTAQWGWNQVTQIHVRVGRRAGPMTFGEPEVLRSLFRWDGIPLPLNATVLSATVKLAVQEADERDRHLLIYRVNRDWAPGEGGVLGNSASPPRPGEVWWNDARFDSVPWGLPGAGYSSSEPDADTPEMPLAEAVYHPGDPVIEFTSPELAGYATEQIRAGEPIRLLLKLSDLQEDEVGSMMALYSGNEGDSWSDARHPRLVLEWEADGNPLIATRSVFLEYGRQHVLEPVSTAGARFFVVSFASEGASEPPWIEVRGGSATDTAAWRPAELPFDAQWDWIQIRVLAVRRPVDLGRQFTAELRDAWIRTAAPEDQLVPWSFVSPSGVTDTVLAEYRGDFTWGVQFRPEEPGPWQYQWEQRFTETPFQSEVGRFDVVVRSREAAWDALARLAVEMERATDLSVEELRERYTGRFLRLERAALQWETPSSYRDSARSLRGRLNRIRTILAGRPIPDSIPFRFSPPADWEREERDSG